MRYFIVILLFIVNPAVGQHVLNQKESEWLKNNIISYFSTIDKVSVEKLGRLSISNDIKVVGLGEANHGTKEFHILKHKIAKYLINDHGFNTVVFEFPYSHGLLLNDYILGINEDGLKIITGQKNSEYHTIQMIEFIEDIKEINRTRNSSNQIQFLGMDIFGKPYAVRRLSDYFFKRDSTFYRELSEFQYLSEDLYLSAFKQDTKEFKKLSTVILKQLESKKQEYITDDSFVEFGRMIRLAELLGVEWKGNKRAKEGAKNILITLNEASRNKILYFAHNFHVGKIYNEVGSQLQKQLGKSYFSIGTDYHSGSFMLKNIQDRKNIFPDIVDVIPMENSFADHISAMSGEFHYLAFPTAASKLNAWMFEPNYVARTGFAFNQPFTTAEQFRDKLVVTDQFDAIIVFDEINPTEIIGN